MESSRRLVAILFTDIVGSTAMMQDNEQTAVAVTRHYVDVLQETVISHNGEIVNDYGDGSLCIFSSATDATRCAVKMQQQLQSEPRVPLRIGLHVGEIFFENGKVFGDGVNVASRVQSLGIANSILFSSEICSKIKNQQEFKSILLGKFHFKNVTEPIEVHALANDGFAVPDKKKIEGKLKEKAPFVKKIFGVSLIVMLGIIALLLYNHYNDKGFTGEKSIAVLPFENSGEPDSEEYISDGITQDIINSLSKISSLKKVIGWFSVRSFKKTTKSLKQIADELGVAAILSGTIQKHDGKVHIVAELTEVGTNKRLWGNDFEYESKDILSVQTKVAEQIVTALKANLTPEEKKNLSNHYTVNTDAYNFYNKGRSFRTIGNVDSSEANYRRAIEIDPGFAKPYAALADWYVLKNGKGLTRFDAMLIAKQLAEKALSLDSTLSEAFTVLGFIQQNFLYEWDESAKTLKKAIELNPNYSFAHFYYGNLLQFTGDTKSGLTELKKALELDPLNSRMNWALARNYYFAGEYDLAINQCQKSLALYPDNQVTIQLLGLSYLRKKLYTQSSETFNQLLPDDKSGLDNNQVMQSYAYAVIGDKAKAKILFEQTLKKYPDQSRYRQSQVYTALGNFNEAIDLLERGYENRDLQMFWIKVDPAFDPIRNEAGFKVLLNKMNLE